MPHMSGDQCPNPRRVVNNKSRTTLILSVELDCGTNWSGSFLAFFELKTNRKMAPRNEPDKEEQATQPRTSLARFQVKSVEVVLDD
jgi:hypothetical protein